MGDVCEESAGRFPLTLTLLGQIEGGENRQKSVCRHSSFDKSFIGGV